MQVCVEMFRYERVYAYTQIRACICRCSEYRRGDIDKIEKTIYIRKKENKC